MATLHAFGTLIYEQLFETPQWTPSSPTLLTGRTVIVTGSNIGLGFEAAIKLASLDPTLVILAVRTQSKGEKARDELIKRSGIAAERVAVWELDLSSFDSVKAFAGKASKQLDRLDVLLENAGLSYKGWKETDDRYEEVLQVNGIATGLLGVLLLPLLAKTATLPLVAGMKEYKPHLTIVGSEVHGFTVHHPVPAGTALLADLNNREGKNALKRYQFSKLISIHLAHKLAALPLAKGVVVNVVNPGLCESNFRAGLPLSKLVSAIMDAASRTTESGARNLAWACEHETPPGAYVSVTSVRETSPYSRSDAGKKLEDDLWAEMVEEWTKLEPKVKQIVG